MILVVNLNASVDKRYVLKDLVKGEVMRAVSVDNTPGGKGIHVANVAAILGEDCTATGFLGGRSGEFIADKLRDYGIPQDFVKVAGETRSCLAILTEDGAQTEILEPGPLVSGQEQASFLHKYDELLDKADVVAASGSLPQGLATDFYSELIRRAKQAGKKFLLDTSGEALQKGIEAKPWFIKPNKDELQALTGHTVKTEEEAAMQLRKFLQEGIQLAVVSLGAAGSLAGFAGKIYRVCVPHVEAVNPVGSGDSYVAGIAAGLVRGLSIEEILKLAAACGTANALEAESGFVDRAVVQALIPQIQVEEVV